MDALSKDVLARVAAAVAELVPEAGDVSGALQLGDPPSFGAYDIAVPCFRLSKAFKSKPNAIAPLVAGKMATDDVVAKVDAAGPYVNIQLTPSALVGTALGDFAKGAAAPADGACAEGEVAGHTLIEFSSPNTNKPQHLGHVRNNVIGMSVSMIMKAVGRKVTRVNLINDRGIHICKSMLAYKLFGKGETPESSGIKGDHLVGNYYVEFDRRFSAEYAEWLEKEGEARFEKWLTEAPGKKLEGKIKKIEEKAAKAKNDKQKEKLLASIPDKWTTFKGEYKDAFFNNESKLGAQAKEMLLKWEANDKEVRDLWNLMNGWVFAGFDETYKTLGIAFDHIDKESETYVLGKELVQEGLDSEVLHKLENGAVACSLKKLKQKGMQGDKVLLRANGTSVYMTQDLGTAVRRYEMFHEPTQLVYVVGNEQDYHFKVLFGVLALLRPALQGKCYHLSYGMVDLPSGKMKSREGTVVDADDLIANTAKLAAEDSLSRWPDLDEAERKARAQAVALAAVKYYILSFSPATRFTFDPAKSISFVGNTGPYALYCYARTRSILTRANVSDADVDMSVTDGNELLGTAEERELLNMIMRFRPSVRSAAAALDPSMVARAVFAVGKAFSVFYNLKDKHPIVDCADEKLRAARLRLVVAVGSCVKEGLALLGIDTIESM